MGRVVALGVAAATAGGLLAAGLGGLSQAEARTSYCAPSGNYCYGMERPRRPAIVRIDSFVDFSPVTVCIVAPDRSRACSRFNLLRSGWSFARRVRLYFPRKRSRGRFKIVWRSSEGRLGPLLRIRR